MSNLSQKTSRIECAAVCAGRPLTGRPAAGPFDRGFSPVRAGWTPIIIRRAPLIEGHPPPRHRQRNGSPVIHPHL